MRLFVALQISVEVRESLARFLSELRQLSGTSGRGGPKWVRAENLHVTLKFVGEMEPEKLARIRDALSSIRSDQPVMLDFRGLGFFPSEKRPTVLWASMNTSANLQTLARDIELSVENMQIPREQRPFTPHLTLARFESQCVTEQFRSAVQDNISRNFGSCRATEFHLIESKLKPSGAEYTTVQSFCFTAVEG